jgi:protein SCO1/2
VTAALLLSLALAGSSPSVVPGDTMPGPLRQVGYEQNLGKRVDPGLAFRDEAGRAVRLGDYFGERPVVLVLAYYRCPMLCDMVLEGLVTSVRTLSFTPGKEYDVVVVSINPKETAEEAAAKKRATLIRYARKGTAESDAAWHFLTGSQGSIAKLADAVGFHYVYDPSNDQYAHAAGIVVLTPDGRTSRYLLGIEYAPRDLRLALIESSQGRIGNVVDQILLYCFHYDPVIGRYSAMTFNVLRLAAVATVVGLVLLIVLLRRRERRERREPPAPSPAEAVSR